MRYQRHRAVFTTLPHNYLATANTVLTRSVPSHIWPFHAPAARCSALLAPATELPGCHQNYTIAVARAPQIAPTGGAFSLRMVPRSLRRVIPVRQLDELPRYGTPLLEVVRLSRMR